tara:strand:+ start:803 stop:1993 length:1191 start_codon:yes stop_codon:yes gene_type:complete
MPEKNIKLFLEINDKSLIFLVILEKDKILSIIQKEIIELTCVENGKLIINDHIKKKLKKTLNEIEKKNSTIFHKVIVILNYYNSKNISISSSKNMLGSKINNDDVTFLINKLKSDVLKNEKNKDIIHIFNTNFILDFKEVDSIPINSTAEFYGHSLSFFLIDSDEKRKINTLCNSCNLDLERIILKNFVRGINLINTFLGKKKIIDIKINNKNIQLSFFENAAYKYSETFNFGSNIIYKDVAKVCKLSLINSENLIKETDFNDIKKKISNIEEKYFDHNNLKNRQISLQHVEDIINSRISEICDILLKKNINLSFANKNVFIKLSFEDVHIYKNFSKNFKIYLDQNIETFVETQDEQEGNYITAMSLVTNGWKSEALPIKVEKRSLLSRFFRMIFK